MSIFMRLAKKIFRCNYVEIKDVGSVGVNVICRVKYDQDHIPYVSLPGYRVLYLVKHFGNWIGPEQYTYLK